ncbi:hypothetical protein M413DRAFT_450024 [Hebeloma cylindrosporum]|uniref:EH domain-containing protein n=1 Tax=Hebeloma cylindrosporum TaxID=76867 RepID=A0A0C3BDI6_HEBCY|nr:hypothetical protein M413DRAFT_450024 [Hebeloma cylindrosporum h7]
MASLAFPEPTTGDDSHIITSTPRSRPRYTTDDSKYPNILPEELDSPTKPILSTASTLDHNQEKVWKELTAFYLENEEVIEKSLQFDVKSIDKASELDVALITFLDTADVILQGLVALSSVHPVLGIAIFAFHGVVSLDLTRRDNNRKVLAVKLQMQNMMCAMFQLRKLRHIHVEEGEREEQQSRLQRLVKAIADEIKACGSDLNYYLDRKFISKMINAKSYQSLFAEHVETFARRRSELQSTITSYIAAGIDAANIAITEVKDKVTTMDVKLDAIIRMFKKLDTPREREVLTFIEENGGATRCVEKDELLTKFLAKAGENSATGKIMRGQELMEMRDMLRAEVKENYMDLKEVLRDNLARFERLLNVQNNNLRNELVQQRHEMQNHSMKLDQLFQTSVLILEEGKLIRKAAAPRLTPNFKDPDLQYIWDLMGLKGSVKAKTFVLTFRDHLLAVQSRSGSMAASPILPHSASSSFDSEDSILFSPPFETPKIPANTLSADFIRPEMEDLWVLNCINVTHVQPIVEALDEDGSGFISVKEANKFAGSRPTGWSFLRWIAYWGMGWHINITTYRSKIYWIIQQMHEALLSAHPANRSFVDEYLNHSCFNRIEALLRSIKPIPDNARKDSRVSEIAESMVTLQESRLEANLTEVSFIVESVPDVALITGLGRVETWILPLLYLLLRRHLDIINLAQKRVLKEQELSAHVKSLMTIFSVFDERIQQLESIFLQVHRSSRMQFESFAYGMFYASVNSKEKKPSENTLLTFKDNKVALEEIQESFGAPVNTSILTRGLGGVFKFEEVDLKQRLPPPGHIPHSLEGTWTGKCIRANNQQITFQGFFHCVIGPIVNRVIVGKGESYLGPVEIEGVIQDGDPGRVLLDFRINSDLYADLWCRGEYNAEKQVIHGQWVIEDDSREFPPVDDNEKEREMDFRKPCGRLYMTRTPPSVFRFRDILDFPGPASKLTVARRRWIYACKAVTFQLQNRVCSPKFFQFLRAGTVERRKWVELTIRRELDKTFTDTKPQLSEDGKNELWALRLQVHPTNGRLYDLLALYLFRRMFYNVGSYFCHSCQRRIIFERYQCVTCMDEDLSTQIDLCADCIGNPNISSESNFAHDSSHSLIRSTHRIHECELASMIPQARLRSERIKSSFRTVEAKDKVPNETSSVDSDQEARDAPAVVPFRCACCSDKITLPCWVCLGCALDTFICLDCDVKRRPVSRDEVQAAAHSYGHPLLRLYDSAEAKPVGVKSGRLERHLQEMETRINDGLSSLEEKVNVQLDQVKVQMQAVADEVAKKSTATHFGSVGVDADMLPGGRVAEENKARDQSHIVNGHAPTHAQASSEVEQNRITALETKMEQRFHSLETKVDTQLNLLLSLMRQVVGDAAGRQA